MMKKILSIVLTAALMGVLVMSLTACGSKKEPETTTAAATEAATEEKTEAPTEKETEAPAEEEKAEVPAGDAITVAFEDFDAQEALSKSIQNMEATGKAVEIEGISRKIGTKYSIGQVKDGKFIGTDYTFDGEYPAEDAHIILKGTVVQDGFVCTITAESIETVE